MAAVPPDSWQPPTVSMETTMGPLVLELYWQHAPRTCKNFAELSRRGYYNGTKFHRIIKDFMVQGGDPTGTGRGGASIYGKQFEDELHPDLKFTGGGMCSMFPKTLAIACHVPQGGRTLGLCPAGTGILVVAIMGLDINGNKLLLMSTMAPLSGDRFPRNLTME
ncbi:Peptidyl-prolyl cis-trans isomerase-like 1 [Turdus rufiventris]|nr:Peptidyl-prolyl cis-trans isomerase-like 1 [Turdus rufiventris]